MWKRLAGFVIASLVLSGCAMSLTKITLKDEDGNPVKLSDGTPVDGIEFRSDRFERGTDVTILVLMACPQSGCFKVAEAGGSSAATIKGLLNQAVAAGFIGAGLGYGLANQPADSMHINQGPIRQDVGPVRQTGFQSQIVRGAPFGHRHGRGDD